MFRTLQLLLMPGSAWTKIAEAKHGIVVTLAMVLLPILLLTSVAEAYAMTHWGLQGAIPGRGSTPLAQHLVSHYEVIQFVVSILLVFLGAGMISWLGQSFHFYPPFIRYFTVTLYGLSPIFLARFLNCIPVMNIWMSWAIGIFGCIYVLYQGIGIVLEPDATKGFGLYLMSSLILALLGTIAHLINLMVMQGKI